MLRTLLAGASLLTLAGPALAAPSPSGLIGDHAVLQRGKPIAVEGTATPNNMELPVERAQDAGGAIHGPADDQLRLVTIAKVTAPVAQDHFAQAPVWAAAGPQTIGGFSAACFYMARALRDTAKVPIGAIHASWGGSAISAWMGDDAQRAAGRGEQADLLKLYARDPAAAMRTAAATWETWWRAQSGNAVGHEPWQPSATLDWQAVP